jgi:hypothetical protein
MDFILMNRDLPDSIALPLEGEGWAGVCNVRVTRNPANDGAGCHCPRIMSAVAGLPG